MTRAALRPASSCEIATGPAAAVFRTSFTPTTAPMRRLGLAYQLAKNTVVRAGAGLLKEGFRMSDVGFRVYSTRHGLWMLTRARKRPHRNEYTRHPKSLFLLALCFPRQSKAGFNA